MDDLITRLRAAIDETEQVAKAAYYGGSARWHASGEGYQAGRIEDGNGTVVVYDEGRPGVDEAQHIALHDPERELRMVAAHRKILDLHAPYDAADDGDLICQTCLERSHLYEEKAYPCPTLLALAGGYGIEA